MQLSFHLSALSRLLLAAALIVTLWPAEPVSAQNSEPRRRVKVLFLGDQGHHQPLARARQVYSAMAKRGIDLTYTERMSDLNPQTLALYDTLLLFANITRIAPEQEQALLDYVANGGGFAPIHCGSYCFLNSPKITALTGGRFKSHGTGTFKETIVKGDHELMKDLKPIESWDETYVHEMHNEQDRIVLSLREDSRGKEPYTWVRTHGKGRVFYTAWGHDQRTWGNEDFQNLLERGLRWSSGDWALKTPPLAGLKPFEYFEADMPNYPAGRQWGITDPNNKRPVQQPLAVEESMKHLVIPPGFEVSLFASDPDIKKPICMAWDERGRLWVAETTDYPNEMQPEGQGNDKLTICEDTNNDGKADRFTVFADKLSIPTSIAFANGGVIVHQAPQTLFLKDTDGDGKADERKVLLTGWGTRDTHAGPSNLRYGLDNWIYGIVGYSGFQGTVGGKPIRFAQNVYRFKPDGSAIEPLANVTNNAWGVGISEEGHVFASTANNDPSFYVHIPNRYYESIRGWTVRRLEHIADSNAIFPITEKVRQVDQHGKITAAAGQALYTARSFPKEYWNRVAFLAEPTGHLLARYVLQRDGSAFKAINDFNMLSSTDEWTAPIMAEVGPDGSLWVIDWYNIIVQHNPTPRGFRTGRGAAYETPLRDKRHGRVYRLTWKAGKPSTTGSLGGASPAELVDALKSDNQLWRLHAQRLLVEKQDKSVINKLIALVNDKSVDEVGLNTAAIHGIWTLAGLGALDGSNLEALAAAQGALAHQSAGVRKAAVEAIPPKSDAQVQALGKLLKDADAQVRKSAFLALADLPASDAAGAAVFASLSDKTMQSDRWLLDAASAAAARHDAGFLKAAFAAYPAKDARPQATAEAKPTAVNLIANPSFEEADGSNPAGWRPRNYSGTAKQEWTDGGRTGAKALRLSSEQGADTSWFTNVTVQPNTDYRLTGWIRTENLTKAAGADGALFNIHGTEYKSKAVTGASDWTKIELPFNSGNRASISINCLFGGWGAARGVAYYDDLQLVPAEGAALSGLSAAESKVLSTILNHWAQGAPADSVAAVLASARNADPALTSVVIETLSNVWPADVAPALNDADVAALRAWLPTLPADTKDRLLVLSQRWGKKDLFAAAYAAAVKELQGTLVDAKATADQRAQAARRLITLDDTAETVTAVLAQVKPLMAPDVQISLLGAVGESKAGDGGRLLVEQWSKFTPRAQQTVMTLLLRRAPWTRALLDGLREGKINPKDLQPQHWQALTRHPEPRIRGEASRLQESAGRNTTTASRKEIVDKLIHLAEKKGDAVKGKAVFTTSCVVCHAIEGAGGQVGPDLTGIGARQRSEILMEILDPNRSLEGTYRNWIARTKDDVIAGRLLSESQTSVELIDAAGQKHNFTRDQLRNLTPSDVSVMPEGFEQIPEQDLTDLLEYLATSNVKH